MDPLEIIAIVSVLTAAGFWIFTQWNIIRTKNTLLKFQKEARSNASELITEQFEKVDERISVIKGTISMISSKIDMIKIPNLEGLQESMQKELSEIRECLPDVTEIEESVMEAVNGQLTQLGPVLTAELTTAMAAQLKSYEREKTRQLGQQLAKFGIAIDEAGEAMQGDIIAQAQQGVSPLQIAVMNFLGQKVSPAYAEENPGTAMFFNLAKVQAVQFMQDQGLAPAGIGNKAINSKALVRSDKTSPFG